MINWIASWNHKQASWLQLAQSGQISAPRAQTLQVSASTGGLNAGTYTSMVVFSSRNDSTKLFLNVTLIIRSHIPPGCVSLKPQSLTFTAILNQSNSSPQKVAITNNCGNAGSLTATSLTDKGGNWINLSSTKINLPNKATQNITVAVVSAKLPVGTYTGQVMFHIGEGKAVLNVTLIVNNPILCISPSSPSLSFTANRGNPAPQTVTISNCGISGTLVASTSTTDGTNWLSISPSNVPLEANTTQKVTVSISSANLPNGSYSGAIRFTIMSNSASQSQTVSIMLEVTPQPQCNARVDQPSLNFTEDPSQTVPSSPQNVAISSNCTQGWSAMLTQDNTTNGANWLSIDTTSGTLNPGNPQTLAIGASLCDYQNNCLSSGSYTGSVNFMIGSSTVTVFVTLTVSAPCFVDNTNTLYFSTAQGQGDPAPQTVVIGNTCGDGNWTASVTKPDWLSITPTRDILSNGNQESITVIVSNQNANLSPGSTYVGQITFTLQTSAESYSLVVYVEFTINP